MASSPTLKNFARIFIKAADGLHKAAVVEELAGMILDS
jgi:hypothetical protein